MSFGPDDFLHATGVSRETLEKLQCYADHLVKWQRRINLVGPETLGDLWRRHMLDSAQLAGLVQKHSVFSAPAWLDLGSGAGFPGLVIAIWGGGRVHLVESREKKCAFLRHIVRELALETDVHQRRIENLSAFPVDIITARALAPIDRLIEYAAPFLQKGTEMWLLKGQDVEEELTKATICWNMQVERYESRSDPSGVVLRLRNIRARP